MKTNQYMTVLLGNFGNIHIGHKTQMGKASDVIDIGNRIRLSKGLRALTLDEILRTPNFWEFALSYYNSTLEDMDSSFNSAESAELKFSDLTQYIDKHSKVKYTELMKKFPHLISSKRGRYGGTHMHLYLLLKLSTKLDTDLEVKIYRTFVENDILKVRDSGGDNFKLLNKAIDTLPDRIEKNNRGCYIQIAKMIRKKFELKQDGWNDSEHDFDMQENRLIIERKLISFIEMGFVSSWEKLKLATDKV